MKPACHKTKQTLLETAMDVIWESSYGSVSIDDICKRADVKKGSFYYFFPSKADLMIAAMDEHWARKQADMDRIFSPQLTVTERLNELDHYVQSIQGEKQHKFGKVCGCPYFTIGSELSTQEERIRVKVAELMERHVRYYESLVRDAVAEGLIPAQDTRKKANEMFSYALGLGLQAKVQNSLEPLGLLLGGLTRLLGLQEQAIVA